MLNDKDIHFCGDSGRITTGVSAQTLTAHKVCSAKDKQASLERARSFFWPRKNIRKKFKIPRSVIDQAIRVANIKPSYVNYGKAFYSVSEVLDAIQRGNSSSNVGSSIEFSPRANRTATVQSGLPKLSKDSGRQRRTPVVINADLQPHGSDPMQGNRVRTSEVQSV